MATLPSWLKVYDQAATEILGKEPKLDLLLEDKDRSRMKLACSYLSITVFLLPATSILIR
jgi:hypothetical protein